MISTLLGVCDDSLGREDYDEHLSEEEEGCCN